MSDMDMTKLLSMLSKMDKKDLEAGLAKASEILKSNNKDDIINTIKKENEKN